jgi:hypothetical protein
MKTEEEIKKEIAELKERIEVRKKEIIQATIENEYDDVRINTLSWSLITTPCETPATEAVYGPASFKKGGYTGKEMTDAMIKMTKSRLSEDEKISNAFAGDGPIPDEPVKKPCVSYDDEDEFIPWKPNPKKKRKHNPSNEANDFDTESEINQFI